MKATVIETLNPGGDADEAICDGSVEESLMSFAIVM